MGTMFTLFKRLLLTLVIMALLIGAAVPAFAQQTALPVGVINTGNLNLRSGPGVEYGSIAVLPEGFGVYLLGRNAALNWIYVSTADDIRGWVNVNYIKTTTRISSLPINDTEPASPIVPAAELTGIFSLTVYARPDSTFAPAITTISLSQQFELIGRSYNAKWAQIRLADGTTGWVEAKYLSGTVPVRSLAPTDGSVFVPLTTDNASGGTNTPRNTRTHTIKAGETLMSIAKLYNVDMYAIAQANNIWNINLIYAGTSLVIPGR
jgi:uncharacterized protein YraI